jgi:hypothetical protein
MAALWIDRSSTAIPGVHLAEQWQCVSALRNHEPLTFRAAGLINEVNENPQAKVAVTGIASR